MRDHDPYSDPCFELAGATISGLMVPRMAAAVRWTTSRLSVNRRESP